MDSRQTTVMRACLCAVVRRLNLELFSYRKHSSKQEDLVEEILSHTTIVHSNDSIVELTIQFRKRYALKTPDAIILATAAYLNLPLFTADRDLLKVTPFNIIEYSMK